MRDDTVDVDVRVRYVDTDQMGVVHHGNYVTWFEVGRTEFCRSRRFTYRDLESMGYRLMITDLRCLYRKAVRYDEVVTVRTRVKDLRRRMVTFGYEILCKETGTLIAKGDTRHICLDVSDKPRTIPESFRSVLSGAIEQDIEGTE
jgi:acyl-CoA thioester hydrolase